MKQINYSELSDQDLLTEANKNKSNPVINAVLIGVMIGVVIFSAVKSTIGFFTLIPLYFAYKLISNSKSDKALEKELINRKLK